jgi:hypothetical protein
LGCCWKTSTDSFGNKIDGYFVGYDDEDKVIIAKVSTDVGDMLDIKVISKVDAGYKIDGSKFRGLGFYAKNK